MYAIVRIAGHQFQLRAEDRVRVPRLPAAVGDDVTFDQVLAVAENSDAAPAWGAPLVPGAHVVASLLQHGRERRILVFHKKRRKDHRKKNGHRQPYSEIRVKSIHAGTGS